jgi:hypothetical protein
LKNTKGSASQIGESWIRVRKALLSWESLGAATAPNGARLIGHVPHVAPMAYLHTIFPPLSEAEILELERIVGRRIPQEYTSFLRLSNGLKVFMKLSLDGLRTSFARDVDSARLPFSLETTNVQERPRGSPVEVVFIGSYSYDGSNLWMRPGDPRVYRCPRREFGPVLNTWHTFDTMLESEVSRLAGLFGPDGRLRDSKLPTTPSAE